MPLSDGTLISVDAAALKALRAIKGDVGRRDWATARVRAAEPLTTLALSDTWRYLEHLAQSPVFRDGRSLHRGQFAHMYLSEPAGIAAGLARLPADEAGFRRAFLAMDEAAFNYRNVPFWVKDEWAAAGVTTTVTDAQADKVWAVLAAARAFVAGVAADGQKLVFFTNYRLS